MFPSQPPSVPSNPASSSDHAVEQLFPYKYQPLYFEDFGENSVVHMLDKLVQLDELNVLLIGDMASGKTSILNATLREYFKGYERREYLENIMCVNALKEQGINYLRNEVKLFCQTSSAIRGRKKIVVMDDMDYLTEHNQQVFRNLIDKYSHQVHFLAACSQSQKVIESIQSRMLIAHIEPLNGEQLEQVMDRICMAEKIEIHPFAKQFILDVSNGAVKTLVTYLEKFKLINREINLDLAMALCTNVNYRLFDHYSELAKKGDLKTAILTIYSIHEKGYSVMDILDNYFSYVKTTSKFEEEDKYKIIPILCKYITAFHDIHEDEIELAMFTNHLVRLFKDTQMEDR